MHMSVLWQYQETLYVKLSRLQQFVTLLSTYFQFKGQNYDNYMCSLHIYHPVTVYEVQQVNIEDLYVCTYQTWPW